jgi:hypothetical protein
MKKEIWKDINGFEGIYQVSNLGRVKSVKRTCNRSFGHGRAVPEKMLSAVKRNKYLAVTLWMLNSKSMHSVHRLVAAAFLPNPENKATVNHIDGNKMNNHVENLEWATHSENSIHAFDNGLRAKGEGHPNSKLTKSEVIEIRTLLASGQSQQAIATKFNVSKSCIKGIKQLKNWSHL